MLNLKNLRQSKKLTQGEVAKLINTTQTCYNYYEKEKRQPSIETLCKLADYYNVSLDYLIGRNFGNEVGYLTDTQKNIVYILKQLNDDNLNEILSVAIKMIDDQKIQMNNNTK